MQFKKKNMGSTYNASTGLFVSFFPWEDWSTIRYASAVNRSCLDIMSWSNFSLLDLIRSDLISGGSTKTVRTFPYLLHCPFQHLIQHAWFWQWVRSFHPHRELISLSPSSFVLWMWRLFSRCSSSSASNLSIITFTADFPHIPPIF